MSTLRTPSKGSGKKETPPKHELAAPNVRRSIGEWELAANIDATPPSTNTTQQIDPAKTVKKQILSQITAQKSPVDDSTRRPPKTKYLDRTSEAKACLTKSKIHLNNSKNLRADIKAGVIEALDRLYQLVKEAESDAKRKNTREEPKATEANVLEAPHSDLTFAANTNLDLITQLQEHSKLILDSNKRMEELKDTMEKQRATLERTATYASVAANQSGNAVYKRSTLHSIVITSPDETETGEEVLDKVRKAVDAKEGWVTVERVRKAKDRKVIMGFRTKEERNKIKNKLEQEGTHLSVEEMKNKDPLLVLRDVLAVYTDEDVLKAFRNQNRSVFQDLDTGEDRVEVKYRRRARNPLTCHIVLSVSPIVWKRATDNGTVHIDLQRVRVEDQSPLVQCTRCLGYGHGKRFCKGSADLCSHCGGPHLRKDCADVMAEVPPACRNCTNAKLVRVDHNAFSSNCPTRRRWDELARSTVAYC